MHRVLPMTLSIVLLACNPEIREAERRQEALEAEVEHLEAEVSTLKKELRDAGLLEPKRARSKAKSKGRQRRSAAKSHDLGIAVARTGAAPPVVVGAMTRTDLGCGWKALVPELKRLSDFQLIQRGMGKSSPLQLSIGGRALEPHGFPKEFNTCRGSFRHAGTVALFSPHTQGADLGTATFEFAPDFPTTRADGRPLYWIHPGQTASFRTSQAWQDSWGPAKLHLTADAESAPSIEVDGTPITPGALLPGAGPWHLEVKATSHTLIDVLRIGNATHAATITAPDAWR